MGEQAIVRAQAGKQQLAMDMVDEVSFMVYGGARGCFSQCTDFLTRDGWVAFDSYVEGMEVAVFDPNTLQVSYEAPERYLALSCDTFIEFVGTGIQHKVSTEHTLHLFDSEKNVYKFTVADVVGYRCIGDRLRRDLNFYNPLTGLLTPLTDTEIKVHQEPNSMKYCFEVSTGSLVVKSGDVVSVSGNSGKSYLLNMLPLKHMHDPFYKAVAFRREYSQILQAGGIFETASQLYPQFGAVPHMTTLTWNFPSGASLKFSHMQTEQDAQKWRGSQLSACFIDEINQFSKQQVTFLMTCLRSKAKMNSYMFGTTNPDPSCDYLLDFIEYYLDEEGYPRKDRCGKVTYFLIVGGDIKQSDNEQYLIDTYPDACKVYNPNTKETVHIPPKKFTFIGGTVFDNQKLLDDNPTYVSELQNLPDHERARELHGNWYAIPESTNYFQREWLSEVDTFPHDAPHCRAWDKAATEPSEVNKHPDYTACSARLYKQDGYYYIVHDAHERTKDPTEKDERKKDIYGQFRLRSGDRDNRILRQAQHDGKDCHVVFSVDPASAGKSEYESSSKTLTEEGFIVKPDPMPSNKSKLTRFVPFATACQNGLVRIVRSSFPNEVTYKHFMKSLEAFTGEPSNSSYKDDIPDAMASAFNYLQNIRVVKIVKRNQNSDRTKVAEYLQSRG